MKRSSQFECVRRSRTNSNCGPYFLDRYYVFSPTVNVKNGTGLDWERMDSPESINMACTAEREMG